MQEELAQVRKVKSLLKNMMQNNDIHFADSSFKTFTETVQKFKGENDLSHMDYVLMHEYYADKLKQKEIQKKATEEQAKEKNQTRNTNDVEKTTVADKDGGEARQRLLYDVK